MLPESLTTYETPRIASMTLRTPGITAEAPWGPGITLRYSSRPGASPTYTSTERLHRQPQNLFTKPQEKDCELVQQMEPLFKQKQKLWDHRTVSSASYCVRFYSGGCLSLLLTAESAFVSLLTLTRSQVTYLGLIEVELGSFREQKCKSEKNFRKKKLYQ